MTLCVVSLKLGLVQRLLSSDYFFILGEGFFNHRLIYKITMKLQETVPLLILPFLLMSQFYLFLTRRLLFSIQFIYIFYFRTPFSMFM